MFIQCYVLIESSLGPTWIVFILSAIFTFIQKDELNYNVTMVNPERIVLLFVFA